MGSRILIRRDTAAHWTSANPTLMLGEMGYETDTTKVKIGDGSTAWTSLAYWVGSPELSGTAGKLVKFSGTHGNPSTLGNNSAIDQDGTPPGIGINTSGGSGAGLNVVSIDDSQVPLQLHTSGSSVVGIIDAYGPGSVFQVLNNAMLLLQSAAKVGVYPGETKLKFQDSSSVDIFHLDLAALSAFFYKGIQLNPAGGAATNGGANAGSAVAVDVSLKNIVRLQNSDGAHAFFDLTTAIAGQLICVTNEGNYPIKILEATGFTDYITVTTIAPHQNAGKLLYWNSNLPTTGKWVDLSNTQVIDGGDANG